MRRFANLAFIFAAKQTALYGKYRSQNGVCGQSKTKHFSNLRHLWFQKHHPKAMFKLAFKCSGGTKQKSKNVFQKYETSIHRNPKKKLLL